MRTFITDILPFLRMWFFSKRFFDGVYIEIKRSRAINILNISTGAEYEEEEAESERFKRFGARMSSRYLNMGVGAHVSWPKKEVLIKFDKYELVLMPKTQEKAASLHIDLSKWKISDGEGLTIMNRFLSMMTWVGDHFAVAQDGRSGNPVPIAVPKRNLAFVAAYAWFFERKIPDTDLKHKAIAIYREGRNAEENYFVSYAVLSYYKTIELIHPDKNDKVKKWIERALPAINKSGNYMEDLARFNKARGAEPEEYIAGACRIAWQLKSSVRSG